MRQRNPDEPRPYDYLDFRIYLRDAYEARKRVSPSYSYRYIGRKLGLDGSTVARIHKGERKLDPGLADRFARLLGLDEAERLYFETLVLFSQAKSQAEQNHFLQKLFRQRGSKVSVLEERQYSYYSDWTHLALREVLNFYPFKGDHSALGRMLRPAIGPEEARAALQVLIDLDLVRVEKDGTFILADKAISSGESIRSLYVKNMQRSMAELAVRSLEDAAPRERDFSGLTCSISSQGFGRIKERLKECRREIMEIIRQDENVDRVFRLNLQLFPLSRVYLAAAE